MIGSTNPSVTSSKKLSNSTRYILYIPFLSVLLFILLSQVSLSAQLIIHNSLEDFATGSYEENIDPFVAPGELKLKRNKTTYTETGIDLTAVHSPYYSALANPGTENRIQLSQGQCYSIADFPELYSPYDVYLDEETGLHYFGSGLSGVTVIDTNKTDTLTDDKKIASYRMDTQPAIPVNGVTGVDFDKDNDLIYIAASYGTGDGVGVIDTKGTPDPSDDTGFAYRNWGVYNTNENTPGVQLSPTPKIASYPYLKIRANLIPGLIFFTPAASVGLEVINTNGTPKDPTDDSTYAYRVDGIYNITESTTGTLIPDSPAIASSYVANFDYYDEWGYLFISTRNGLSVIDTKKTPIVEDDTFVFTYNTTSDPALLLPDSSIPSIFLNESFHAYFDRHSGLIYNSSRIGAVTIIDTKKTKSPDDDIIYAAYTSETIPALPFPIPPRGIGQTLPHPVNSNIIYISSLGTWGIAVIDTKNTAIQSDDILLDHYTHNSMTVTPYLNRGQSQFNEAGNRLYVTNAGFAPCQINTDDTFIPSSSIISNPLSIGNIPTQTISWEQTIGDHHTASIQTRTGTEDAYHIDTFDDGDTSNILPLLPTSTNYFNSIQEEDGKLILSEPNNTQGGLQKYTSGQDTGFFPIGSIIRMKIHVHTQAKNIYMGINADYFSNPVSIAENEEVWSVFSTDKPYNGTAFNEFYFAFYWDDGTWNNDTDYIEIDWVSIENTNNWNEWSRPCTNNYGCDIDQDSLTDNRWIQYKLNLSTSDTTTTPYVNSVTYARGYQSFGSFYSKIIDAGRIVTWGNLNLDSFSTFGTDIRVYTRSGNTPVPDETWSVWEQVNSPIPSPSSQYLQYRIDFSSDDPDLTPTVSSISISFEEILVETGTQRVLCLIVAGGLIATGVSLTKTNSKEYKR